MVLILILRVVVQRVVNRFTSTQVPFEEVKESYI